ncbi:protein-tyrosine phosphatase family protein [Staphylococcus pasteuri]
MVFESKVIVIVILIKIDEDEHIISYAYIPEDKTEYGKGKITLNKQDSKVIDYTLSKLENERNILTYRNKSFLAIRNFIKEDEFPSRYLYAWY